MADKRKSPLEQIREENIANAQRLGVALHPMAILQAHLTVLVEGLGFSYELEKEFAELLEQAEAEQARRKLTQGLTLP